MRVHAYFLLLFGAKTRGRPFLGETFILYSVTGYILINSLCRSYCFIAMESPGQRRGSCGHKMAGFDMHDKCSRLGKDPCIVGGAICKICDSFTSIQTEMLATPQYQIRKDKKAGLLVCRLEM